jgi:hypothetical protein
VKGKTIGLQQSNRKEKIIPIISKTYVGSFTIGVPKRIVKDNFRFS